MTDRSVVGGAGTKYALIVTLDGVDPYWYSGWPGQLEASSYDRVRAKELLAACDKVTELHNENATRESVAACLQALAQPSAMNPGDELFIYFSGHGGTLPDLNGDEKDGGRDSTWFLYDGMFVHDELVELLLAFPAKVSVVVVSESCYSERIAAMLSAQLDRTKTSAAAIRDVGSPIGPDDISQMVYEDYREMYDAILTMPPKDLDEAKAEILVFSACGRDELSYFVRGVGSVFTRILHETWAGGNFGGTYEGLYDKVTAGVSDFVRSTWPGLSQTPKITPHPTTATAILRTSPFKR